MSCARALSLFALQLVQLVLQVGRAGLVAVLEVAGLTGVLWHTGAFLRVESARFVGVIAAMALSSAALAPLITSACRRR